MIICKKVSYFFIINKKLIRKINTGLLAEAMQRMESNKILKEASKSVKNEDYMEKMNKLKEKVEMKVNIKKHETIQENLNESLSIMKELNANFKNIKDKSLNIEVKIEDTRDIIKKDKIENLNIENKYHQQDIKNVDNIKKNDIQYLEDINQIDNTINNSKKSILEVE